MNARLMILRVYRALLRKLRPNSGLTTLAFNPVCNYLFSGVAADQIAELCDGGRVEIDITEYSGRILWLFGTNDIKVSRTVNASLAPGMKFLDIGANYGSIGLSSTRILRGNEREEVHFFEPQPILAEKIRKLISSMHVKNGFVHEVALCDSDGKMSLSVSPLHSGVASLVWEHGHGAVDVEVKDTYNYLRPIIGDGKFGVKLDVEGAEPRAAGSTPAPWTRIHRV